MINWSLNFSPTRPPHGPLEPNAFAGEAGPKRGPGTMETTELPTHVTVISGVLEGSYVRKAWDFLGVRGTIKNEGLEFHSQKTRVLYIYTVYILFLQHMFFFPNSKPVSFETRLFLVI